MRFITKTIFYLIAFYIIIEVFGLSSELSSGQNNFEFILNEIPKYVYNNPTLFVLIPLIFGALLYYFGSMILANNWQYNKSSKFVIYLSGVTFLYRFFFSPIVLFAVIIYIIEKFDYFNFLINFKSLNPVITAFFMFVFLDIMLDFNSFFYDKIKSERRGMIEKMVYQDINNWHGFKILFYSLNYLFLITTSSKLAILFLVVVDFIILSVWANIFAMRNQEIRGKLELTNNKPIEGRLIEQINDGTILKIQTADDSVEYIPMNNIKKITVKILPQENLLSKVISNLAEKLSITKK